MFVREKDAALLTAKMKLLMQPKLRRLLAEQENIHHKL